MGIGKSKAGSQEEGGEKVVIKNSTKEEVVIREKNRKVHGPVRYTIPAEDEAKMPCAPPDGTYFRHAVLVGKEEIGVISNQDLITRKQFTIRGPNQGGKYEIITEEPSQDSSKKAEASAHEDGAAASASEDNV